MEHGIGKDGGVDLTTSLQLLRLVRSLPEPLFTVKRFNSFVNLDEAELPSCQVRPCLPAALAGTGFLIGRP